MAGLKPCIKEQQPTRARVACARLHLKLRLGAPGTSLRRRRFIWMHVRKGLPALPVLHDVVRERVQDSELDRLRLLVLRDHVGLVRAERSEA